MMQIIRIPDGSSFFEVSLGGEVSKIDMYYSKSQDRYIMDIENKRTGDKAEGLPVNVGVDILSSAGRVGLEVLMAVSAPQPLLEASLENIENGGIILVYMDIQTYEDTVLHGGQFRQKWLVNTPNGI